MKYCTPPYFYPFCDLLLKKHERSQDYTNKTLLLNMTLILLLCCFYQIWKLSFGVVASILVPRRLAFHIYFDLDMLAPDEPLVSLFYLMHFPISVSKLHSLVAQDLIITELQLTYYCVYFVRKKLPFCDPYSC